MITQEELKQRLLYDAETGIFVWIKPQKGIRVGDLAGNLSTTGYARIGLDGISYQAHRLVYLYIYGYLPDDDIDHINGIRNDNRLCNLRLATRGQNNQNRKFANKNNKTGHKGIWRHQSGKYRVSIGVNNKNIHLGYHNTLEEAIEARKAGELLYHPFSATMVTSRKQPF